MILLQAVADGSLGGGTTHVLQLIEAVRAALPVEVHLLSQTGSPALVAASRLGAIVHGLDFFTARTDPRLWLAVRRLLRQLRPALIHAHGARAGLPVAELARAPLFYTVHGYHFLAKRPVLRHLGRAVEARIAARADLAIFVAEHDHAIAGRCGILARCRRQEVIRNGIVPDGLPEAVPGDGRTLAFLGRLEPIKNPLLLLEVLDRLQDEGFRLMVIGDGPLRAELQARAERLGLGARVVLLGSLPHEQAMRALARTNVLLLPSLSEGLPLAPLEAMAIGVPVVASRVGGLTEVIEDGRSGLLVDGPEPDLYASAIRRLTSDRALRERLVEAARVRVRTTFAWATARRRYLDLYRQALLTA